MIDQKRFSLLSPSALYRPIGFQGKSAKPKPVLASTTSRLQSNLQKEEEHRQLLDWVSAPFDSAVTAHTPKLAQWSPMDLLKGLDSLRWGPVMKLGTTILNFMIIPGFTVMDGLLGISSAETGDPHQKPNGIWALDHPENRKNTPPYGYLGFARDMMSQTLAVNLSRQAWSRSFIPLVNHGMERGETKNYIGLFEAHRGIDLLVEKGLVEKTKKKIRIGYAKSEPLLTGYKITPLGFLVMKQNQAKTNTKQSID